VRTPAAAGRPAVHCRSFQLQHQVSVPDAVPGQLPLGVRIRTAALACAAAATVSAASVGSVAAWREHERQHNSTRRFEHFRLFGSKLGGSASHQGWWQQAARSIGVDPRHVQGLLGGAIGPIMALNAAVYVLWRVAPRRVMQRHFTSGIRGPPWAVLLAAFSHASGTHRPRSTLTANHNHFYVFWPVLESNSGLMPIGLVVGAPRC
jgi:hypothetical protein